MTAPPHDTSMTAARAAWIAVDWGTTNMRAFALDSNDRVLGEVAEGRGMAALSRDEYEPALLEAMGAFLPPGDRVPVLVCGMAGARQGWREAAYLDVPARLDDLGKAAVPVATRDPRLEVRIVPGLAQRRSEAPDVIRGEETQLLGLLAERPGFEGLAVLPGTHAKWARIENGAVTRFTTFMTGELFGLLTQHSVLRHSVGREAEAEGFAVGLEAGGQMLSRLFSVRAGDLLFGRSPGWNAGYLSGLLIGAEVKAALGPGSGANEGPIALVGAAALIGRYAEALAAAGRRVLRVDGEEAALKGLARLRRLMDWGTARA